MDSLGARFTGLIDLTWGIRAARTLAVISAPIVLGLSGSVTAQAATATANLTVQLTVTATCSVNAATLNFGSTGLLSSPITASTSLSVTCTNSTPYSVGLDNGANFNTTRRMKQGTNFIGYGLYTDAGLTNPWTTASSSTTCTTTNSCALGTGNGSAQSITVFGQVPALGTAPAPAPTPTPSLSPSLIE